MSQLTRAIRIRLITIDSKLISDVSDAVDKLNRLLIAIVKHEDTTALDEATPGIYGDQLRQSKHFLECKPPSKPLLIELHHFRTVESSNDDSTCANSLIFDCTIIDVTDRDDHDTKNPFDGIKNSCSLRPGNPHTCILICTRGSLRNWMMRLGGSYIIRSPHEDEEMRRADLFRLLMDHLDHTQLNKISTRANKAPTSPVIMATEVTRLMSRKWGDNWDFHYFTGSMIARFIDSMQSAIRGTQIGLYSGCNEHQLAASALAGWQLYERAYVIAITSGMIDELRGTLSNLKRANAPGLIICAESSSNIWYAFQGTVDIENNGHTVISARGLRHIFIEQTSDINHHLCSAFHSMEEHPAPTILFATQTALESTAGSTASCQSVRPISTPLPRQLTRKQLRQLDTAAEILLSSPQRILWQCGRLTCEEREKVICVADRAGIALADSITHPGSIASHPDGACITNYLGTLSMYGFTHRIHDFLEGMSDEPLSVTPPWIFFLKSKIDQASTPYSEGKLRRRFRIAQVNSNARHIAPFAHLALEVPLKSFLDYMDDRVKRGVNPQILQQRQHLLRRLSLMRDESPTDRIQTVPMTPNYFFLELRNLVENMIMSGYRYTGIYDVGRCSLSAIRNIPRTDPGFSGWYGRALMGDALMALPYIASRSSQNILAFIGDGARRLVPDIEQQLAMYAAHPPWAGQRNITVFFLNNGSLSMIQTYLDKRHSLNGSAQVNVPIPEIHEYQDIPLGPILVSRRRELEFDSKRLHAAMTEPGRLNLLHITLGHNSDGDGLSLLSESSWNRFLIGRMS